MILSGRSTPCSYSIGEYIFSWIVYKMDFQQKKASKLKWLYLLNRLGDLIEILRVG